MAIGGKASSQKRISVTFEFEFDPDLACVGLGPILYCIQTVGENHRTGI